MKVVLSVWSVGSSRLRMESRAVAREKLDTAGESRREMDGGTRRHAADTAARARVLFTLYPALCQALVHAVWLLLPGTLRTGCCQGMPPLSPPHRAPTTPCQVQPSPLLTQPQPQGLLYWLLNTAWGEEGSTLAHLRAFACPFPCLEPLSQVHGRLAVTLKVQCMCHVHREAFFDSCPPPLSTSLPTASACIFLLVFSCLHFFPTTYHNF